MSMRKSQRYTSITNACQASLLLIAFVKLFCDYPAIYSGDEVEKYCFILFHLSYSISHCITLTYYWFVFVFITHDVLLNSVLILIQWSTIISIYLHEKFFISLLKNIHFVVFLTISNSNISGENMKLNMWNIPKTKHCLEE